MLPIVHFCSTKTCNIPLKYTMLELGSTCVSSMTLSIKVTFAHG
jgi:hypothetical protein